MEEKPPSYQWYPRDFRAEPAVDAMTFDQRGRYQWALDASWLTQTYGVAPEDEWRTWMHYTPEQWAEVRNVYLPCFRVRPNGLWVQKRMKAQRDEQVRHANSCSLAGRLASGSMTQAERSERAKLAAAARWRDKHDLDANRMLSDANSASASASATALESKSKEESTPSAPPAEDASPTVFEIPLRDGTNFNITEKDIAKWEKFYPDVLVMDTLREQAAWLDSNPERRKTRRGVKAFINRWLLKEQNSPPKPEAYRGSQDRR